MGSGGKRTHEEGVPEREGARAALRGEIQGSALQEKAWIHLRRRASVNKEGGVGGKKEFTLVSFG